VRGKQLPCHFSDEMRRFQGAVLAPENINIKAERIVAS